MPEMNALITTIKKFIFRVEQILTNRTVMEFRVHSMIVLL